MLYGIVGVLITQIIVWLTLRCPILHYKFYSEANKLNQYNKETLLVAIVSYTICMHVWHAVFPVPIHRSQPSNYRLVSLTSVCCNALEHIIYSYLLYHLQTHGILCEEHHGFQTGKSCDSQIIVTIDDFVNCLNEIQIARCYIFWFF